MKKNVASTRRRAIFLFDPETIKAAKEPSPTSERLVWMIVRLVRSGEFSLDRYIGRFNVGETTFKRDVAQLRALGARYGFRLGTRIDGRVPLERFEQLTKPRPAEDDKESMVDALRAVVDALGDVIGRELSGRIDLAGGPADRFLRIATPRLIASSAVAGVYAELREAWMAGARVRFRYPSRGRKATLERIVEPYLTTYVAGRYYLVGFDARPGAGWRQFALDRITGPVVRAGTFRRHALPPAYRGEDAIGLFKTGPAVEVTIELSAAIAEAVIAREWQRRQRTTPVPGGGSTITFEVHDVAEAVRWALGFGVEARVLGPPEAVALCRTLALEIAEAHAPPSEGRRQA